MLPTLKGRPVPTPRVLVIGIDGGSFDTIDPLVERGELPHMAALLRDSASAATSTTWPAHTAPGWASMTSASYPGRHGVYQFFDTQHPAYGETLVGTTELGRSSMWEWAADQGWSGGMINVPMSHPPRDLPGYQLTWPLQQTLRYCQPPTLLRELATAGAHFQPDLACMFRGDYGYLDKAVDNVAARVRSARHLMTTRPTDLTMVVITEPDRVGHHYWHFGDPEHPDHESPPPGSGWDEAMTRIYRAVDDAVGELVGLVDDDPTVVLVSDHGLARGRYSLGLHGLLEDAGLLTTVPSGGKGADRVANWFTGGGRTVDFGRTSVYMPVPGSYGLTVNQRGRQVRGRVAPRDRARLLEDLQSRFDVRTPTGDRLFRTVLPREEVYPGPWTHRAPDFVLLPADETVMPVCDPSATIWGPSIQTGLHRHEGVWAQRSSNIVPGRRAGTFRLVDTVPTMFAEHGIAWPDDVDGRVHQDAFTRPLTLPTLLPADSAATGVGHLGGDGDDDLAFTSSRLREMGYL